MTERIGLIIPSSNRMVEQEMVRHFPPGVQAHVARLRMTGRHHAPLAALMPRIAEATAMLCDARCTVVALHCTATAMAAGAAGERELLAAMAAAGAAQAFTTATAVCEALAALGARRLVLITPYDADTTAEEVAYLAATGCDVLTARGLALAGSDAYCATPASFWRDRTLEAAVPEADAYFLSCANISTFPVLAEIERRLGRPVVTSNQAVVWAALRRLGRDPAAAGLGRLFAPPAPLAKPGARA
jgi:maleate isomerase